MCIIQHYYGSLRHVKNDCRRRLFCYIIVGMDVEAAENRVQENVKINHQKRYTVSCTYTIYRILLSK